MHSKQLSFTICSNQKGNLDATISIMGERSPSIDYKVIHVSWKIKAEW
jgi:hypothetical protein